jgi:hypothetical protein
VFAWPLQEGTAKSVHKVVVSLTETTRLKRGPLAIQIHLCVLLVLRGKTCNVATDRYHSFVLLVLGFPNTDDSQRYGIIQPFMTDKF